MAWRHGTGKTFSSSRANQTSFILCRVPSAQGIWLQNHTEVVRLTPLYVDQHFRPAVPPLQIDDSTSKTAGSHSWATLSYQPLVCFPRFWRAGLQLSSGESYHPTRILFWSPWMGMVHIYKLKYIHTHRILPFRTFGFFPLLGVPNQEPLTGINCDRG